MKFYPNSDQELMIYSADNLLNKTGDYVLAPGKYLNRYPHQLGFVIYVMVIYKVLNLRTNMIILQNLNVIYSLINCILLYFITKELFEEERVHKIAGILIGLFSILYWTFFDVHIYGNIPGLMFALIATLFTLKYFKNHKIKELAIVAVSLTISYLLKNNYMIFALAIFVLIILDVLKNSKFKKLIAILVIAVVMFGTKTIIYKMFENGTGYKLDSGVPTIAYLYMAIAENSIYPPGWYTGDVEVIYNAGNFDKEEASQMASKLYSERVLDMVKHPGETIVYFARKLGTTWLNPTYQTIWCSTPGNSLKYNGEYNKYIQDKEFIKFIVIGKGFNVIEKIMDVYQVIIYGAVAYCAYLIKDRKEFGILLIPIIFLGGMAFHFIWETKAIYVIQYYFIIIPYASYGICKFFDNKILKKIKEEIEKYM